MVGHRGRIIWLMTDHPFYQRRYKLNNDTLFRRVTAVAAIIAGFLVLASTVVLFTAVDFDPEFLANPGDLLTAGLGEAAAGLFHWGSILELFGDFLLLIPLTLYLWFWLEERSPRWVTLYTVMGLMSLAFGILGAVIRTTYVPSMMVAYPQAGEPQRQVLQVVFQSFIDFTFVGLYAIDSILGALWWLGIGLVLRAERRILGLVTVIFGIAVLGAGLGWILQIDPLARLEFVYFFEPFWLLWVGIILLRGTEHRQPSLEPASAT
jgi:hypothetical protein